MSKDPTVIARHAIKTNIYYASKSTVPEVMRAFSHLQETVADMDDILLKAANKIDAIAISEKLKPLPCDLGDEGVRLLTSPRGADALAAIAALLRNDPNPLTVAVADLLNAVRIHHPGETPTITLGFPGICKITTKEA